MPERRPLRLVHTSDVHLGGHQHGSLHDDLSCQAFANVVELGNRQSADLLLIAGDFFDHGRVTEPIVRFAADQIARFAGRAVLLPGNHDWIDEGGVYSRFDMEAWAPNLAIIRDSAGQTLALDGLDAVIWGKAYLEANFHHDPLAGLPTRLDDRWHIVIAHGHFVPGHQSSDRTKLIHEHEIHAAGGHWDYMAFGHWDVHADVSANGVTAIYSGAPHAYDPKSQNIGWAAVVDFDHRGVTWELHRTDPRPVGAAQ